MSKRQNAGGNSGGFFYTFRHCDDDNGEYDNPYHGCRYICTYGTVQRTEGIKKIFTQQKKYLLRFTSETSKPPWKHR